MPRFSTVPASAVLCLMRFVQLVPRLCQDAMPLLALGRTGDGHVLDVSTVPASLARRSRRARATGVRAGSIELTG